MLKKLLTIALTALSIGSLGTPEVSSAASDGGAVVVTDDPLSAPTCELGKTAEDPGGECTGVPTPKLCVTEKAGPRGEPWWHCVAAGASCAPGKQPPDTTGFCKGQSSKCPVIEKVLTKVPKKCFVQATLPPRGGDKYAVKGTNPPCESGEHPLWQRCAWMCLKSPAGTRIKPETIQYSARNRGGGGDQCSNLNGYIPFDPVRCGTKGDCAPSYYTWVEYKTKDDEVCALAKNWSHDTFRCVAISFEVKK